MHHLFFREGLISGVALKLNQVLILITDRLSHTILTFPSEVIGYPPSFGSEGGFGNSKKKKRIVMHEMRPTLRQC